MDEIKLLNFYFLIFLIKKCMLFYSNITSRCLNDEICKPMQFPIKEKKME